MNRNDHARGSAHRVCGTLVALGALLVAAAGCGEDSTAASATFATSTTGEVVTLDDWCGLVREVGVLVDDTSFDAPMEQLRPDHRRAIELIGQLIDGLAVVDARYQDDVRKVLDGQRRLSQMVVDATDASEMRAAADEIMSETFVVDEGTYEWVGTTCGLDGAAAGESSTPLVDAASHGEVSVVVDQSPTVSDLGALGFLAARPDVTLLAVTMPGTGEADCTSGAITTRAVLDAAGRDDVPIGCGGRPLEGLNEWPAEWRASANGLAELVAPGTEGPTFFDANSVLLETLAAADEPVTVVVLGPLTNIAAVLGSDPTVADRIREIVVMGGAVDVAGNVDPDLDAEWNFHAHPAAAQAVLASGVPIVLVPLDATDDVPLLAEYVAGVGSIDNDLARVESAVLGAVTSLDGMFMWDELAAVVTVQPEVASWSERRIVVSADGSTTEAPDGSPVRVAVGADAASVRSIVLGAFNEFG